MAYNDFGDNMFKTGKLKDAKIDNFEAKQVEKGFYFEIYSSDENYKYFMELSLNKSIDDILKINNTTDITKDVDFSVCYNERGPVEMDYIIRLTKYIDDRYLLYISYTDEEISGVMELEIDFENFK